jgi:hypothetical protein
MSPGTEGSSRSAWQGMLGLAALPDLVLYQRLVLVFELVTAALLGPDGKPDARQLINDILAMTTAISWSIMISLK